MSYDTLDNYLEFDLEFYDTSKNYYRIYHAKKEEEMKNGGKCHIESGIN